MHSFPPTLLHNKTQMMDSCDFTPYGPKKQFAGWLVGDYMGKRL